jgi:hypothetical protein
MKQKYAERRAKQRANMLRDRKLSKERLKKRPEWNNDWHNDDDVEVLVSDQQYESVKLQQQQQQMEQVPRNNPVDRYLKHGSTDFQLNNGNGIPNGKANANPFSSNGAFKDASGSAVAKKKSSSSNDENDDYVHDNTREIMFHNDGAAEMPRSPDRYNQKARAPQIKNVQRRQEYEHYSKRAMEEQQHRKYGYRQQQQHQHGGGSTNNNNNNVYIDNSNLPPPASNRNYVHPRQLQQNQYHQQQQGSSGWTSNEPSPYGYDNQHQYPPRHQHGNLGGDGGIMYSESPQREQYRRDIAAEERRKIYEQNQQAMLRNKRRHEEEIRRHHPSAIGVHRPHGKLAQRATSAPMEDSAIGNNNNRLSVEEIRKAKLRRRESDDIQYREKLKLAREQAHQDRLRVLAKKEERERKESMMRQNMQSEQQQRQPNEQGNSLNPEHLPNKHVSKPRTRKQIMEEKRLAQEKKDAEYRLELEKARIEAYEQRQKLRQKHQKQQKSQESNSNDKDVHGQNHSEEKLKNTGRQNSEELGNAQTDAVMKAVMSETMNLDLTTSIAISEDDLWRNNENKDDEQSAEDIVGLAESLINILGGDEVTSNFFSNSSAVVPNHDKVRISSRNKGNKPKRINIDEIDTVEDDGDEIGDDVIVINKSGKTYNKPVTPLDQSTDSLGVLFRKARGHGGTGAGSTRVDL